MSSIVTAADFGKKPTRVPEGGNAFNESYSYVWTAITTGSTIKFGIIPAGVEINSCKYVWSTNNAGSLTLKLGYTPVDATDGPAEVLDYFFAATAITTAGAVISTAMPITFDFPVILVGTTAAATGTAGIASAVVVSGKVVGVK